MPADISNLEKGRDMSAGNQRPIWRKSSHSSDPDLACCVELAATGDGVRAIRDSVDPDGPRLTLPVAALRSLIETVKAR